MPDQTKELAALEHLKKNPHGFIMGEMLLSLERHYLESFVLAGYRFNY